MISNIEVGDKIIAIEVDQLLGDYELGDILTVVNESDDHVHFVQGGVVEITAFTESRFKALNVRLFDHYYEDHENKPKIPRLFVEGEVGELSTRKVGKDRFELFDQGFPNAVREIVRVMTWANLEKGYKDHDWKNIPDPENVFSAAASRHRNDFNAQKVAGLPANQRVDHESNMNHLAHQAFNVIAELELILTGKIE